MSNWTPHHSLLNASSSTMDLSPSKLAYHPLLSISSYARGNKISNVQSQREARRQGLLDDQNNPPWHRRFGDTLALLRRRRLSLDECQVIWALIRMRSGRGFWAPSYWKIKPQYQSPLQAIRMPYIGCPNIRRLTLVSCKRDPRDPPMDVSGTLRPDFDVEWRVESDRSTEGSSREDRAVSAMATDGTR
jgi:hypothetical protein